jgi:hypothetical protein
MTNRYEQLAEFLADRYLAVQETKTAATSPRSPWDILRPENPDRPGANWWSGLGAGAMAGGAELGVGRYGLTDTVRRSLDRATLGRDPFSARIHQPDFRAALADDEATRFLTDLFRRHENTVGGKARVGKLLRRHDGELDLGNGTKMNQVRSGLQGLIDPNDTEMLRRWNSMTMTHAASGERVKRILDRITQRNPGFPLTDHEWNLLTKFRTSIGKTDSADQWDELRKGLRNLAASVQGGKKGAPVQAVFSDRVQRVLNHLATSPATGLGADDPAKIHRLLQSFGQFTKGRPVPSLWRRLGRAGGAAGIAAGLGAYALPSAVDFGKWLFRSPTGQGVSQ